MIINQLEVSQEMRFIKIKRQENVIWLFGIKKENQIGKKLSVKMTNEVLQTIKKQLESQNVNLNNKTLIKINPNTLRVSGGGNNVDIKYNKGDDLYDIKVHKINKKNFSVKTCSSKGVYVDSLPNFFNPKIVNNMKGCK